MLPLIEETPVENETNKEKFITIELKCKAGASTASTGSYKKHIRIFENGTPQEFINVRMAIQEVWNQNGISTPTDKVNIIRMVIKGESFTIFQAKISKLTADGTSLTREHIVEGLNAIAINAFPHRALFYQKRWMQNGIKKPRALTTRQTVAALTRINNALPMFPGATQEDKFTKTELLQIMEWMIPTEFQTKFEEKGYIPTGHDRKRFIEECKIVERLQALRETKPPQLKNSNKKKVQGRSKINFQEKNRTNKYCSHHGANKGHNSEECWTLHPELKPKIKGPRLSNNKIKKEINSLA